MHQVAAEGDLRSAVASLVEQVLQQRRVKHDVAVVGDEEITLRRIEAVEAVEAVDSQVRDGAADDLQVDVIHDAQLKLVGGADGANHATHLVDIAVGEDVAREHIKGLAVCYALHGGGNLVRDKRA